MEPINAFFRRIYDMIQYKHEQGIYNTICLGVLLALPLLVLLITSIICCHFCCCRTRKSQMLKPQPSKKKKEKRRRGLLDTKSTGQVHHAGKSAFNFCLAMGKIGLEYAYLLELNVNWPSYVLPQATVYY